MVALILLALDIGKEIYGQSCTLSELPRVFLVFFSDETVDCSGGLKFVGGYRSLVRVLVVTLRAIRLCDVNHFFFFGLEPSYYA